MVSEIPEAIVAVGARPGFLARISAGEVLKCAAMASRVSPVCVVYANRWPTAKGCRVGSGVAPGPGVVVACPAAAGVLKLIGTAGANCAAGRQAAASSDTTAIIIRV